MNNKKLVLLAVALLIVAYVVFDLGRFLDFDYLKSRQAALEALYDERPVMLLGGFFLVYVAVTALSVPGAVVMTLVAGAIFGLVTGTVLVSFASSIGATLAFLVARYLLRDSVERRFRDKLSTINDNLERDGAFYLFTLRLVPVFPFFLVNLVMGLTRMKTGVFYAVSQVGMLAGTLVFVNAGTQLAKLDSPSGILSPGLLFSFALLGLFPLLAKKLVELVRARQAYQGFRRPDRFERDIVVLGAGSGGLVTAYIGAAVKSKVTLIEKHRMGGDCLNTGCVPSKALIKTARVLHTLRHADDYGIDDARGQVDFRAAMARVQAVIRRIEPHDSIERYTRLGVEVIQGTGRIVSPWQVEVDGRTISTRNIVIATGASPFVPPIPGLEQVDYLTSDTLWSLDTLPPRLVVLGGGPIGCELAQAFRRLGSEVWQVEMAPRIMGREDDDVAEAVTRQFEAEGIHVLTGTRAVRVIVEHGETLLECEREATPGQSNGQSNGQSGAQDAGPIRLPFDRLLVAVGRRANTDDLGLEALDIARRGDGTIDTNAFLQTRLPNIYAVGDVAGPYQFTHTAAHQAWYAAVNALFGTVKRFRADYRVIPRATFTDPEVAHVGLNERSAAERGIAVEVTRYGIDDLDRAIADGADHGFVKVLTEPGKDRILGVTIVGEHAGDLIAEYVLAMRHGLGLNKLLGTIHIYPTLAEANKYAAGEWKRAHQPERVLRWLEWYHGWRRG